jgi:hypothetical protein
MCNTCRRWASCFEGFSASIVAEKLAVRFVVEVDWSIAADCGKFQGLVFCFVLETCRTSSLYHLNLTFY